MRILPTAPRCADGCRSLALELGTPTGADHHAYTCSRCTRMVCAMCGVTPVDWAGYVCTPCLHSPAAPIPVTAGQLRAALDGFDADTPILFRTPGHATRMWAVDDPAFRPGRGGHVLQLRAPAPGEIRSDRRCHGFV